MDGTSGALFSYVDLEEPILLRHPLRKIRQVLNDGSGEPRCRGMAALAAGFDDIAIDGGRSRYIVRIVQMLASSSRCVA